MNYWWLSFADPYAEGDKFVGACVVAADSFEKAVKESILQGCNAGPHTEVQAMKVRKEHEHELLSKHPINKFLSRKELNDKGRFTDYERRHSHH